MATSGLRRLQLRLGTSTCDHPYWILSDIAEARGSIGIGREGMADPDDVVPLRVEVAISRIGQLKAK